jgi:hypothetical protein
MQVEADIEQQTNRVKVMNDHLKNVKQELSYTQALVETKSREKENESHLLTLGMQRSDVASTVSNCSQQ